jgi:hypothetical protein
MGVGGFVCGFSDDRSLVHASAASSQVLGSGVTSELPVTVTEIVTLPLEGLAVEVRADKSESMKMVLDEYRYEADEGVNLILGLAPCVASRKRK